MGLLADRLADLAQIPSRAARGAADGINLAIQDQYATGTDAYGRALAPLAERTLEKHGEPALQGEFGSRPGDMAEGTLATPGNGAGIEISIPFPGAIHQTGAKNGNWRMPARRMLPQGKTMPAAWKAAIDASLKEAFGKAAK